MGGAWRLARQTGDLTREGEALVSMGQASFLGTTLISLRGLSSGAEIAEALGVPSILAGLLNEAMFRSPEVTGHLAEARTKFDRALTLSRQSTMWSTSATALVFGAARKLGRSLRAGGTTL